MLLSDCHSNGFTVSTVYARVQKGDGVLLQCDMSDAPELRERLFKARRLLLATSVILLAHYALGIQVKSDAESLGLKFELPDVQRVWFGVWVVWMWALAVYLQHCHEFGFDDFPSEHFGDARYRILRWFDRRKLLRIARTKGLHNRPPGVPTSLKLERPLAEPLKSRQPRIHFVEINWNGNDSGKFSEPQAVLTSLPGRCSTAWAWFFVMTTTRFGTDYFAPILIAVVTFGYGICSLLHWRDL
jgi:hypothetical protein